MSTFIIDCPSCKAKVAAQHKGEVHRSYFDEDAGEPFGYHVTIGECPSCKSCLVGRAEQIGFKGWEDWEDNGFCPAKHDVGAAGKAFA